MRGDWWAGFHIDMGNINKESEKNLDDGQKPERLIQNIIKFTTQPNDIVLDYHLGSDTTAAVAHKMGRQYIGIEQMAILFDKSKSTINEHILNIYKEKELTKDETLRKIGISDFSTKPTNYYNLDVIISVGYRVKSLRGTEFRKWATARLKEYIIKGFTMDDERLKGIGGGNYWKELPKN